MLQRQNIYRIDVWNRKGNALETWNYMCFKRNCLLVCLLVRKIGRNLEIRFHFHVNSQTDESNNKNCFLLLLLWDSLSSNTEYWTAFPRTMLPGGKTLWFNLCFTTSTLWSTAVASLVILLRNNTICWEFCIDSARKNTIHNFFE